MARPIKNKDSIFIFVCSVDSFKPAYSQIKSNPGMLTPGNSRRNFAKYKWRIVYSNK